MAPEAPMESIASDGGGQSKLPGVPAKQPGKSELLSLIGSALGLIALVVAGVYAVGQGVGFVDATGWLRGGPFPDSRDWFGASYDACEEYVKGQLEAPITAEFPGHSSDATELMEVSDPSGWRYHISSYVDAQNSSGAKVRSVITCDLTWGVDAASPERRHWIPNNVALSPWAHPKNVAHGPETPAQTNETAQTDQGAIAIELAKRSHALEYNYRLPANSVLTNPGDPVLHDTEHSIQNELAHMAGALHVVGWQAQKVDDQTYLVAYTFEDAARAERSWYFEVNLAASIVRNVLADPALKAKYHLQ